MKRYCKSQLEIKIIIITSYKCFGSSWTGTDKETYQRFFLNRSVLSKDYSKGTSLWWHELIRLNSPNIRDEI